MKLLREYIEPSMLDHCVVEDAKGEKDIWLRGVFAQAELINKNSRFYPKTLIEREVKKLQPMICEGRLVGNLDHPESPDIKLEEAAILITELAMDGNNVVGKAKVLKSTPKGSVVYGLAKDGVQLAVSTRGVGSLNEETKNGNIIKMVQENFNWITEDVVGDPSAPEAFVQAMWENKQWVYESAGWREDIVATAKEQLKKLPKNQIEEGIVSIFKNFLRSI
jgi:hypothetical protein